MKYDKLGNLCLVKGGKRLPKGKALLDYKTEHPYLRITDYASGNIDLKNLKYISNDVFDSISKYTINKKDIFLSIVGTIGIVDIIDEKLDGASLTENAVKIIVKDRTKIDVNYLAYYLKSTMGQYEIDIRTVGSTQKKLAITRIKDIPVPVIEINKQRKIASVLSSLDSKIKLNNQIISNLEELSSTLFKRWFVDFEFPDENGNPYKSSGGKMVDSELGKIPEGWHIDIISNLMENFDRKRVPLSKMQREKRKGEYPYYGAASLMDYVDDFLFDGIHLLLGEDGTVITKEGNPVLQYVWGKFWVNNHAHVLKGKGYVSTEWLYLWFKQTNVSGIVTGAVQPKISQTNLNRLKVVFPDKELLIKFQKNIGIMFDKLVVLSNEMTTLTELRDTLLPRLLSGEIELSEDGEV